MEAPAQRNQQILRHIPLRKTRLLRLGAIDVNMQTGLIENLLDAEVRDTRNVFQLLQ